MQYGVIKQCGCMMVLSQAAADVSIRNNDGMTITDLAEKNGNRDISATYRAMSE